MTTTSAKTIANGQTLAERKLAVDRLEAVLQGMIVMLRDNPDIPVPWCLDYSGDLDEEAFQQLLDQHDLTPLQNAPWMVYLSPIIDKYTAAEDRAGLYMPWSIGVKNRLDQQTFGAR